MNEFSFFDLLVPAIYLFPPTHTLQIFLRKTVGKNGLHLEIIDHEVIVLFQRKINNLLGYHISIKVMQSFFDV